MKRNIILSILVAAITASTGCQPLLAPLSVLPTLPGTSETKEASPGVTSPVTSKGTLDISIRWPERSYPNFNAQAIPTSTSRIELVAFAGPTAIASASLVRPDATAPTSQTSMTLDAGMIRLEARAYREDTEIANGDATVTVLGGARAPARITLGPLFAPTLTALSAYGGAVQDTVTLTGTNFGEAPMPAPEVRFNEQLATTVTRISSTSLSVTVPSGATTGNVSVKADGIPSTSNVTFWVADGMSIAAGKAYWDPTPVSQRIVLFGETLQFNAHPSWVFRPGESADPYGNPPAVDWAQVNGSAGTLNAAGLFTAGTTYATADIRASLGSIQSGALRVSAEEVTDFTLQANRHTLGGKGALTSKLSAINTLSSGATTSAAIYASTDATQISVGADGIARAEDFGTDSILNMTATSRLRPALSATVALTLSNYSVTTVAGGLQAGTSGEEDGDLNTARFRAPEGITVAPDGSLFVTDTYYQSVRKIRDGQVSTLITSIFAVWAITWGPDGNLYVPNRYYTNNSPQPLGSTAMRIVSATGSISYLPGTYLDPHGVTFDPDGNLYYSERQRVRKRTPEGGITTFGSELQYGWVDEAGTAARFLNPTGLAADSQGNVYVADTGNHSIRKITPAGVVSTLAGTGAYGHRDGAASQAQFDSPHGVAVDGNGNVFVADSGNHRIRKITPQGEVMTIAGAAYGSIDGIGSNARIGQFYGITCDANGTLYIAEWYRGTEGSHDEGIEYRKIRKIQ